MPDAGEKSVDQLINDFVLTGNDNKLYFEMKKLDKNKKKDEHKNNIENSYYLLKLVVALIDNESNEIGKINVKKIRDMIGEDDECNNEFVANEVLSENNFKNLYACINEISKDTETKIYCSVYKPKEEFINDKYFIQIKINNIDDKYLYLYLHNNITNANDVHIKDMNIPHFILLKKYASYKEIINPARSVLYPLTIKEYMINVVLQYAPENTKTAITAAIEQCKKIIKRQSGAGYYDMRSMRKVVFVTDEEGQNNKKGDDNRLENKCGLELDEHGLIYKVSANTGFVFLGDLVDHSHYSIRLLQHMIAIKEDHQNKTVLIMGNRDANKLRLSHEAFIVKNDGGGNYSLPWDNVDQLTDINQFIELCGKIAGNWGKGENKYQFLFQNDNELHGRLGAVVDEKNVLDTNWQSYINDYFNKNDINRIQYMYELTMGAGKSNRAIIKELFELFPPTKHDLVEHTKSITKNGKKKNITFSAIDTNDENGHKKASVFLALVGMLMSWDWKMGDKSLHEISAYNTFSGKINGLFVRYLKHSNIVALIKHRDKHAIVSHSGLPKDWHISNPYGYSKGTGKESESVYDVLDDMHNDFREKLFGEDDDALKMDMTDELKLEKLKDLKNNNILIGYINKLTHLSAPACDDLGDCTRYDKYAPIKNGNIGNYKKKNLYINKSNSTGKKSGGAGKDKGLDSWLALEKATTQFYDFAEKEHGKLIDYHVYGHKPQGPMPTWSYKNNKEEYKKDTKKTIHICIDVSKAEVGNMAGETYACFVLEGDKTRLMGRTRMYKPKGKGEEDTPYEAFKEENVMFTYDAKISDLLENDQLHKKPTGGKDKDGNPLYEPINFPPMTNTKEIDDKGNNIVLENRTLTYKPPHSWEIDTAPAKGGSRYNNYKIQYV